MREFFRRCHVSIWMLTLGLLFSVSVTAAADDALGTAVGSDDVVAEVTQGITEYVEDEGEDEALGDVRSEADAVPEVVDNAVEEDVVDETVEDVEMSEAEAKTVDEGLVEAVVEDTAEDEEETPEDVVEDTPQDEEKTETEAESLTMTAKGDGYEISVTYDDTAFADDVSLEVSEVDGEGEGYADALQSVYESLDPTCEYAIRVFDIAVTDAEREVEPNATVKVTAAVDGITDDGVADVMHLTDDGVDVMDVSSANDTEGAVEFETPSFSRYVFVSKTGTKGEPVLDLDGVKTPIGVMYKNNQYVMFTSELIQWTDNSGSFVGIKPVTVSVTNYAGKQFFISDGSEGVWTFEAVDEENKPGVYYISTMVDGAKQYMTITPQVRHPIYFSETAGTDQEITVLYDNSGKVRLDRMGFAPNLYHDNAAYGFVANQWMGNSERGMILMPVSERQQAYVTSVSEIVPERRVYGQEGSLGESDDIIIYGEYYDSTGRPHYVRLAPNGNLIPVQVEGDMLLWNVYPQDTEDGFEWKSAYIWKLIEYVDEIDDENGTPTTYYELYNEAFDVYLAPGANGLYSDTPVGISLAGRTSGAATSTIEMWDSSVESHYQVGMDLDNMLGTSVDGRGVTWHFAVMEPHEDTSVEGSPHLDLIETVDPSNVSIELYDFEEAYQNQVIGTTYYSYGNSQFGLMSQTLDEHGWPTATKTGTYLQDLFSDDAYVGEASNLFIKSVLDSTGYYHYDSAETYAWYNPDSGDFEVYRQLGAPTNKTDVGYGNFLPFNSIREYSSTNRKIDGGEDDPRYGEEIYVPKGTIDFNFGMKMDVDFHIPRGGTTLDGSPLSFDFIGDDDIWVYVDGVLVLDLGGIHHPLDGVINFETGVVTQSSREDVTLFDLFRAQHVFPDGTPWDDARVSEYFKMRWDEDAGEFVGTPTFSDYTGHTLTMFYMERGKHASNLRMSFNMPKANVNQFTVSKTLDGTAQEEYANQYYAFQAVLDNGVYDQSENLTNGVYADTGEPITFHRATVNGVEYDDVFFLKPGETAVFSAEETSRYHVRELGVKVEEYDCVMINDVVLINGDAVYPEDGVVTSSSATVKMRPNVTVQNQCAEGMSRDLEIVKNIEEGTFYDGRDRFEFYVFLEDPSGELIVEEDGSFNITPGTLVPYSNGDYYVIAPDGRYCKGWENGLPKPVSDEPVVFERSGLYGTIGSVVPGYTIVIPDILAGTDFLVVERNPVTDSFELVSTEVVNDADYQSGSAAVTGSDVMISGETVSVDAMASIKFGHDSKVVFTNRPRQTIEVTKVWDDGEHDVSHRGDVKLGLFRRDGSDLALVEGSTKTIDDTHTSFTWAVEDASKYEVYEYTGDTSSPTIIPDGYGQRVSVIEDGEEGVLTYRALYEEGTYDENERTRHDVVTNVQDDTAPIPHPIAMPSTGLGGLHISWPPFLIAVGASIWSLTSRRRRFLNC